MSMTLNKKMLTSKLYLIFGLIFRWYKRDENAVPPVYALTQISKFLPDFLSTDAQKKRAATNQFWDENDIMQDALEMAANQVLGTEEAEKYVVSGNALFPPIIWQLEVCSLKFNCLADHFCIF